MLARREDDATHAPSSAPPIPLPMSCAALKASLNAAVESLCECGSAPKSSTLTDVGPPCVWLDKAPAGRSRGC